MSTLENCLISFPINQIERSPFISNLPNSSALHSLYIDHNSLQLASRSRKIISNLCPTLSNIYETSSCPLKRRAHHDRRFDPIETNPRSVQGYRNSRIGFRDEPRKVAGRIVFHRCQAFLTSNRGAWQED